MGGFSASASSRRCFRRHRRSIDPKNFNFSEKIEKARVEGINDLIIDPGFGFSKTTEQNYELLNNLDFLKQFQKPLLVGVSRKSMIYKILNSSPEKALNGTSILHTISILKGANIFKNS